MSKDNADYLNANGVVTALNFIGGWKCWGNRTSIYPASSDVKDVFIPNRRMTDFIRNTIVLSVWQYVDEPGNLRMIDAVVNSLNGYFNGLKAQGALLGARVEFRASDNPKVELLAGHYVFRVSQASPTPAEWIQFLVIFDTSYLDVLFGGELSVAA
jgi:phage tail sheath protein FI